MDQESKLDEYESLKAGKFHFDSLIMVTELPRALIKARIAQGLSQRELAERLGPKDQQIRRYEATDYFSDNLARIGEGASALSIDIDDLSLFTRSSGKSYSRRSSDSSSGQTEVRNVM